MAHTPGPYVLDSREETPWTYGDAQTAMDTGEAFGHTEILVPMKAGDETIAYLPWEPLADDGRKDELRDNAKLLMAAPALLTAARAFLGEFGGDVPDWLQEAADQLIDAIEEAEGRRC